MNEPVVWRRSTRCGNSSCVLVARDPTGGVLISDSKRPDRPPLWFDDGEWAAFIVGVRSGDFDDL